jgi:hypothetical protein
MKFSTIPSGTECHVSAFHSLPGVYPTRTSLYLGLFLLFLMCLCNNVRLLIDIKRCYILILCARKTRFERGPRDLANRLWPQWHLLKGYRLRNPEIGDGSTRKNTEYLLTTLVSSVWFRGHSWRLWLM